jgi:hypothetical protein
VADPITHERAQEAFAAMCDGETHISHAATLQLYLMQQSGPAGEPPPVPMLLHCPMCCARHIDRGAFETKPHHTHACQTCGHCWRPAIVATVGVQFLPGFKDAPEPTLGDAIVAASKAVG